MEEKIRGIAHFLVDARRTGDLNDFKKECDRKGIRGKPYIVEKVIELSKIDFENVSNDLLADREFIRDNIDIMFTNSDMIWHCLLIVQRGKPLNGILIESKRNPFPKFSAIYEEPPKLKLV